MNQTFRNLWTLSGVIFILPLTMGCGEAESGRNQKLKGEALEQQSPHQDLSEIEKIELELPEPAYGKQVDESKAIFVYLRKNDDHLKCEVRGLNSEKNMLLPKDTDARGKELVGFLQSQLQSKNPPEAIILDTASEVKYVETNRIFELAQQAMKQAGKKVTFYVQVDDQE